MDLFTDDGEFDGLSHPKQERDAGVLRRPRTRRAHRVLALHHQPGDRPRRRSRHRPLVPLAACVSDGNSSIAAGRYTDEAVKVDGRWLYRVKQVRFHYFGPLTEGWDENQFALDSARRAAVNA